MTIFTKPGLFLDTKRCFYKNSRLVKNAIMISVLNSISKRIKICRINNTFGSMWDHCFIRLYLFNSELYLLWPEMISFVAIPKHFGAIFPTICLFKIYLFLYLHKKSISVCSFRDFLLINSKRSKIITFSSKIQIFNIMTKFFNFLIYGISFYLHKYLPTYHHFSIIYLSTHLCISFLIREAAINKQSSNFTSLFFLLLSLSSSCFISLLSCHLFFLEFLVLYIRKTYTIYINDWRT